jgi:YVTN family beta-propeller protein
MLITPGGFAAQQKFGPAISEAAEPSRCDAESGLPTPYLSLVGGAASLALMLEEWKSRPMARIQLVVLAAFLGTTLSLPGAEVATKKENVSSSEVSPQRSQEGVAVEFEAVPLRDSGAATGRSSLQEGDDAVIRFKVSDTTTGAPVRGVYPAAWIDRLAQGETMTQARTLAKTKSFLEGGFFTKADVDLNTYYVLTLNDDPTISVVDPLFGFGGSKLLAMISLKSRGDDWVLSADQRTLYVSMPDANAVAVVDTASWEVKASIATGQSPSRVALQPDQHYLWVANLGSGMEAPDRGVTVVGAADLLTRGHIPTGRGPYEITFSEDSRFAFVLNRGSGSLSAIDIASLKKTREIPLGNRPASMAYCSKARSLFITDEDSGEIYVVDAQRHEVTARIKGDPGLGQIRFPPDGQFGFAVNPKRNVLCIIDSSSNRIVQTGDMLHEPYQIGFSDRLAYIRHRQDATVLMVPLDAIGGEGRPVPVVDFPGGQSRPGDASIPSLADSIVEAPGGGAVLVANDKDRAVYFYKEGMAAPVGQFDNYGHNPRAVLAVDRSLKEHFRPGLYETVIRLPAAGTYEAIFLLDSPRVVKSFEFEILPNPELERKRPRGKLVAFPYVEERLVRVGERIPLQFKVADAVDKSVKTNLDDIVILTYLAPGLWHRRTRAQETSEGVYSIAFEPPKPGVYYVHVLKDGDIVPTNDGQQVILQVLDR